MIIFNQLLKKSPLGIGKKLIKIEHKISNFNSSIETSFFFEKKKIEQS